MEFTARIEATIAAAARTKSCAVMELASIPALADTRAFAIRSEIKISPIIAQISIFDNLGLAREWKCEGLRCGRE